MTILDAFWTADVNMLVIRCGCSKVFHHRADRWRVRCTNCGRERNLGKLREQYVLAQEAQS